MPRYVIGSNQPGYLPEGEVAGPFETWSDACAALASEIDNDAERAIDESEDANERDSLQVNASATLDALTAAKHRPMADELAKGLDVTFNGRAYFIGLDDTAAGWSIAFDADAAGLRNGWDLFESSNGLYQIQRDDESGRFPDDDAALAYVEFLAANGNKDAREALDLNGKPWSQLPRL